MSKSYRLMLIAGIPITYSQGNLLSVISWNHLGRLVAFALYASPCLFVAVPALGDNGRTIDDRLIEKYLASCQAGNSPALAMDSKGAWGASYHPNKHRAKNLSKEACAEISLRFWTCEVVDVGCDSQFVKTRFGLGTNQQSSASSSSGSASSSDDLGWCSGPEGLNQRLRSYCKSSGGTFFGKDYTAAKQHANQQSSASSSSGNASSSDEHGWCSLSGHVYQWSRSYCQSRGGTFSRSKPSSSSGSASSSDEFRWPTDGTLYGWCVMGNPGIVIYKSVQNCRYEGGKFWAVDKRVAERYLNQQSSASSSSGNASSSDEHGWCAASEQYPLWRTQDECALKNGFWTTSKSKAEQIIASRRDSSPSTTVDSGYKTINYEDGARYTGYVENGIPHGQGTYYFSGEHKGDRFVGQFRNGWYSEGVYYFSEGAQLSGSFSKGKISHGRWKFTNGDSYIGGLDDNWGFSGQGVFTYSSGDRIQGEWWKNNPWNAVYFLSSGAVLGTYIKGDWCKGCQIGQTQIPETEPPYERKLVSTGTGFSVNGNHVVTAEHVIDSCGAVKVKHDLTTSKAVVVLQNKETDLAVLRIEGWVNDHVQFRSRPLEVGETAFNYGFPLFGDLSSNPILTRGIVNSLAGLKNDTAFFQYDAASQFGNSGGPVLDSSGHLIGIVSHKLDDKETQLVNFATKATTLEQLLKRNQITFSKSGRSLTLSTQEIPKRASTFTTLVGCFE